jgi:NNP family nitrate/nitrite transporter-like MFS transporter
MIPIMFAKLRKRALEPAGVSVETIRREANKETATVIAFSSAIAAYGAFWIPKSYGMSISMTGGPAAALWAFIAFYVVCVVLTWWYYVRPHAEVKC